MPGRYRIFAVLLVPYFLSYFYRSTNAVIAGDLVAVVGLSPEQLGLMTGFYFIAFALAQLPIGPALDRFGSRKTISALLLSTALGSLLFGLAASFGALALGRALIGLGVAGVLVGSLKVFSHWFPLERFATVAGMFVSLGASGALLAATPLVALKETVGWRAVFFAGAALTLLAALLVLLVARDAPSPNRDHPEGSSASQGRLSDILLERRFWQVAFLNFAMVGSFFSYQSLWMGPFLMAGLGLSALSSGNLLLVLGLGSVTGYFGSGWLADRFGLPSTVAASALVFFGTQLLLALLEPGTPLLWLGLLLALFGVSGAFNVLLFAHVRRLFPSYLTGRALALNNLFGMSGVALSQWLLGVALARWGASFGPTPYALLFWLTGGLGIVSLLAYLPLLRGQGGAAVSSSD